MLEPYQPKRNYLLLMIAIIIFVAICILSESAKSQNLINAKIRYTEAEIEKAILWTMRKANPKVKIKEDLSYRIKVVEAYYKAQNEFEIPALLLVAMGDKESDFRDNVSGDNGRSIGIMQVGPMGRRKCREYCGDMSTPEMQIMCGGCWYGKGINWCKTIKKGLNAYAWGKCYARYPRTIRAVQNRLELWAKMHKIVKAKGKEDENQN